jgi:hypothetical protein
MSLPILAQRKPWLLLLFHQSSAAADNLTKADGTGSWLAPAAPSQTFGVDAASTELYW